MQYLFCLYIILSTTLQSNLCWTTWKIPFISEFEVPDFEDIKEAIFNNLLETIDPITNFTSEEVADFHDTYTKLDFKQIDPEAYLEVHEIISYHGYPVKQYTVQTEDGYYITIQQIPYGKNGNGTNGIRKPVLIQHGLLSSSAAWVINTPDKNLPYILADAGYDVWLGNVRGTLFGRKHSYFSPNDKRFWNYSFDEIAKYDLPAVIDFILKTTGFSQIYYVGHSMGTTVMFALLSTQPKYNDIVKGMFAMAPVAYVGNIKSPVRHLAYFSPAIKWVLQQLGNGEFPGNQDAVKYFGKTVCNSLFNSICENILFVLCGFDEAQMNATRLPVFFHHTPAATSVQNVVHLAQMVRSHKFQFHDFGREKNLRWYDQSTPPEYDLTKITTPVAIFWSQNDLLADPIDVLILASNLKNISLNYRVPYDNFSHLDFAWALDVKRLLYNKLVDTMNRLWKN